MKKRVVLGVICMTFAVAACGKITVNDAETAQEQTEEQSQEPAEEPSDVETLENQAENEDNSDDSIDDKNDDNDDIEYLWKKGQEEPFAYEFTVDECPGTYTITDNTTHSGIRINYDGNEEDNYCFYTGDDLLDGITDISFSDLNFDGYTDIIMLGYKDGSPCPLVFMGEWDRYASEEPVCTSFKESEAVSEFVRTSFDESVTSDDIIDYYTHGIKNGEFTSYAEAYKLVLNFNESIKAPRKYNLIYVDEDSVPELVADQSGFCLSMYTFRDGFITIPIVDWGYGAFGNYGYEYSEKNNCIRNINTDYGGNLLKDSFCAIKDGKIESTYYIGEYYFDDLNGNGYPDDDEKSEEGPCKVEYKNYTDEALSEEELKTKVEELFSLDYVEMIGDKTAEEIYNEL